MTIRVTPNARAVSLNPRWVTAACVVGLAALSVFSLTGTAAVAATPSATIAAPGSTVPLTSGRSDTPFTVVLPLAATCPQDTAKGGDHIYSYLVHEGTDVSALTFINSPSVGYGLVNATGAYYGAVNTAIGTGQIVQIPNNFAWAPLVVAGGGSVTLAQLLFQGQSGGWETGLACANSRGATVASWSVPITFHASASDPRGFVWSAAEPSAPSSGASSGAAAQSTPPTAATSVPGRNGSVAAPASPVSGSAATAGSGTTSGSEGSSITPGAGGAHDLVTGSGRVSATTDGVTTSWLEPLGLAILFVAVGVGIVWLAGRQKAKRPPHAESVS